MSESMSFMKPDDRTRQLWNLEEGLQQSRDELRSAERKVEALQAEVEALKAREMSPREAHALILRLQDRGGVTLDYIHARERLKAIAALSAGEGVDDGDRA